MVDWLLIDYWVTSTEHSWREQVPKQTKSKWGTIGPNGATTLHCHQKNRELGWDSKFCRSKRCFVMVFGWFFKFLLFNFFFIVFCTGLFLFVQIVGICWVVCCWVIGWWVVCCWVIGWWVVCCWVIGWLMCVVVSLVDWCVLLGHWLMGCAL